MKQLTAADRWIIVIPTFLFWLIVPVPFWLLGSGFAGQLMFWPSFEPDITLLSILFVAAFYGPPLLIALVVIDALRSRSGLKNQTGTPE